MAHSNGDLRLNQAIHADLGIWMNDDPVWVNNAKAPANIAIQRDLGPGHHAPESVAQDKPFTGNERNKAALVTPVLIPAHCSALI